MNQVMLVDLCFLFTFLLYFPHSLGIYSSVFIGQDDELLYFLFYDDKEKVIQGNIPILKNVKYCNIF